MSELVDDRESITVWIREVFAQLSVRIESDDDDFFVVGGTSLSAMQLISIVEERLGKDALTPEAFFDGSTVRAIADHLAAAHARRSA